MRMSTDGVMSTAKRFGRGMGIGLLVAGIGLVSACGQAATPTFEAEAKPNTIILYSSAKTPDTCDVQAMFSYMQNGERKSAGSYCNLCKITVGKRVKILELSDAIVIEPKIESVKSVCASQNAGRAPWISTR